MTETRQVWSVARRYLAPYGRLVRVEDRLSVGFPDAYYCVRRTSGWLELKLVPATGRCPEHLTREQVMWGLEEVGCGGRWHLLARSGPEWWLMTAEACARWLAGAPAAPVVRQTGRFPVREVLDVIAPLPPPRPASLWLPRHALRAPGSTPDPG